MGPLCCSILSTKLDGDIDDLVHQLFNREDSLVWAVRSEEANMGLGPDLKGEREDTVWCNGRRSLELRRWEQSHRAKSLSQIDEGMGKAQAKELLLYPTGNAKPFLRKGTKGMMNAMLQED